MVDKHNFAQAALAHTIFLLLFSEESWMGWGFPQAQFAHETHEIQAPGQNFCVHGNATPSAQDDVFTET